MLAVLQKIRELKQTNVCSAADSGAFEVFTVKLFRGSLEISSGLKLNETGYQRQHPVPNCVLDPYNLPSSVSIARDLGIDHVKAWFAGKILQVLWSNVSPSPIQEISFAPSSKVKRCSSVSIQPDNRHAETTLVVQ